MNLSELSYSDLNHLLTDLMESRHSIMEYLWKLTGNSSKNNPYKEYRKLKPAPQEEIELADKDVGDHNFKIAKVIDRITFLMNDIDYEK